MTNKVDYGKPRPSVIIVEDEIETRNTLCRLVESEGIEPFKFPSSKGVVERARELIEKKLLIGVITDIQLEEGGGSTGWQVVNQIHDIARLLPILVYTGRSEGPQWPKPGQGDWRVPAFKMILKNDRDADSKLIEWAKEAKTIWGKDQYIALNDEAVEKIYKKYVRVYAKSKLPILIVGEAGTGKEHLAKEIHVESGAAPRTLFTVNCGGIEPSVALAELFGHTASAFTDANQHQLGKLLLASGYEPGPKVARPQDGTEFIDWLKAKNKLVEDKFNNVLICDEARGRAGTIFLDEVATLSPKVAAALLRAVETKDIMPLGYSGLPIRIYCRFITATNEVDAMRGGSQTGASVAFRQDLRDRLAGVVLHLPPLRHRDDKDIEDFMEHKVWNLIGETKVGVDDAAIKVVVNLYKTRTDDTALMYQAGNYRTLRNLMHRALLIAKSRGNNVEISEEDIDTAIKHGELGVNNSSSTKQIIRAKFIEFCDRRHVTIGPGFGFTELQSATERYKNEVAAAFLDCALLQRDNGKGHYDLSEIEIAISGGLSRNVWLNKQLKAEHVLAGAERYFKELFKGYNKEEVKIGLIVKHLRIENNKKIENAK